QREGGDQGPDGETVEHAKRSACGFVRGGSRGAYAPARGASRSDRRDAREERDRAAPADDAAPAAEVRANAESADDQRGMKDEIARRNEASHDEPPTRRRATKRGIDSIAAFFRLDFRSGVGGEARLGDTPSGRDLGYPRGYDPTASRRISR